MQRAARDFARLRALVGDEMTDLIVRKPWVVPRMAALETKRAGRVLPDGPTARAYVSASNPRPQASESRCHLYQPLS